MKNRSHNILFFLLFVCVIHVGNGLHWESWARPVSGIQLAPYPPRKLHVFHHDGDPLGMQCTEIGVFEYPDEICLRCLLDGVHGTYLKPQICLVLLCDFSHQALKRQSSNEQIGAFLEPPNLPQCHGACMKSMGFLSLFGWAFFCFFLLPVDGGALSRRWISGPFALCGPWFCGRVFVLILICYAYSRSSSYVPFQACSPRTRLESCMSGGPMVTRLRCMAHRLVSSNKPTR